MLNHLIPIQTKVIATMSQKVVNFGSDEVGTDPLHKFLSEQHKTSTLVTINGR